MVEHAVGPSELCTILKSKGWGRAKQKRGLSRRRSANYKMMLA